MNFKVFVSEENILVLNKVKKEGWPSSKDVLEYSVGELSYYTAVLHEKTVENVNLPWDSRTV